MVASNLFKTRGLAGVFTVLRSAFVDCECRRGVSKVPDASMAATGPTYSADEYSGLPLRDLGDINVTLFDFPT